MADRSLAAALALLSLTACRTEIADYGDPTPLDGAPPDQRLPPRHDLAVPVDLGTCGPDVDLAQGAGCPCGNAGLCAPATGRLSVQTRSKAGQLAIVVMDDNGCRRSEVAYDQPVGVPRWAPDHERLAYITGNQSAVLHVIRVAPSGEVLCRREISVGGIAAMEVAWANDQQLWLGTPKGPIRWDLANGIAGQVPVKMARFDAVGEGPLVVVDDKCGMGCASTLSWRPSVGMGDLAQLVTTAMYPIGPVRLSSSGNALVYELAGYTILPLTPGGTAQALGHSGDRSPAFAQSDRAIVYATDDAQLRYHYLDGERAGTEAAIPPTWAAVYSPDWTGPSTPTCTPTTTCF